MYILYGMCIHTSWRGISCHVSIYSSYDLCDTCLTRPSPGAIIRTVPSSIAEETRVTRRRSWKPADALERFTAYGLGTHEVDLSQAACAFHFWKQEWKMIGVKFMCLKLLPGIELKVQKHFVFILGNINRASWIYSKKREEVNLSRGVPIPNT